MMAVTATELTLKLECHRSIYNAGSLNVMLNSRMDPLQVYVYDRAGIDTETIMIKSGRTQAGKYVLPDGRLWLFGENIVTFLVFFNHLGDKLRNKHVFIQIKNIINLYIYI